MKEVQDGIIRRLDTVQANGTPGLENSFRDLYKKSVETRDLSVETRDLLRGWIVNEQKRFMNKTIRQLFTEKSTIGKILWYVFIFIIATVVLHSFGIDVNEMFSIFKTLNGG